MKEVDQYDIEEIYKNYRLMMHDLTDSLNHWMRSKESEISLKALKDKIERQMQDIDSTILQLTYYYL